MNEKPPFRVTQEFEIIKPVKGRAYPVLVSEWNSIKNKLIRVRHVVSVFDIMGSVFLGVSGSAFVAYLSEQDHSQVKSTCLILAICTIIFGVLALILAKQSRSQQNERVEDILGQLRLVEERYMEETKSLHMGTELAGRPISEIQVSQTEEVEATSLPNGKDKKGTMIPPVVWEHLVSYVTQSRPSLGVILGNAEAKSMSSDKIVLYFKDGTFFAEQVIHSRNRRELQLLCDQFFGYKVEIDIRIQ